MSTVVTCLDVRRQVGADPSRLEAGVAEHCKSCNACAAFVREMQSLEGRLERAFAVPVPEGLEARIVLDASLKHTPRLWRPWVAAAASGLLTLALATAAYQHQHPSGDDLAGAVVAHITNPEEAGAIGPDQTLIHDASYVEDVFHGAGVRMQGSMDDVTYAHVCLFRGERVVHLVVHGDHGPVTILLLPHIHVDKNMPVDEEGFHGVIVPAGQGSIAIVTNNATPVEPMAEEMVSKVTL
ncbi:MAG TPA: DUF3379 family protein [Gammaproteobacteria bacterium]|jgi:hypothetical protein|nr:DUF3379 family protein [Gammaproteobacteria bacterium]